MTTLTSISAAAAMTVVMLLLPAWCLNAAEPPIKTGDKIVMLHDTHVQAGEQKLAPVQAGTVLLAGEIRGEWVAVSVVQNGKMISGWILANQLERFALPEIGEVTGMLAALKVEGQGQGVRLGLTQPLAGGWSQISYKDFPLDVAKSYLQCGRQRSTIEHSGESFMLAGPMTFRMVKTDPLQYAAEMMFPRSTSVIWVEPGEEPNSVVVTTDPEAVESRALAVLGIGSVPKLKLEFHPVMKVGGQELRFLFGNGAEYWGATKGPVSLAGETYRNLKGAKVRQVAASATGADVFMPGFGSPQKGYPCQLVGAEPLPSSEAK
jgi:hypothetical protein